jgi:hypothetical protein
VRTREPEAARVNDEINIGNVSFGRKKKLSDGLGSEGEAA